MDIGLYKLDVKMQKLLLLWMNMFILEELAKYKRSFFQIMKIGKVSLNTDLNIINGHHQKISL